MTPPSAPRPRANSEADWDRWPVDAYLDQNYRDIHPGDAAVIRHHSRVYREIAPGGLRASAECGAGPNLYPLMLSAAASRRVDAVEPGASNRAYLRRQLTEGADASWLPFYGLCRGLNPALPPTLDEALRRVRVVPGSLESLAPQTYDLASMHFVAESVTEDPAEFAALCRAFVRSVRPGGRLVAAFMENMPSYRLDAERVWPATRVDTAVIRAVFAPLTDRLRIDRVPKDRSLPEYGDTGMVLLSAVRPPAR
ncbi:class I SAM-dependent methyltransferase [Streptomyces sp. NA04227]|uniref:class I SAM-dependent methyltransferase n=1 Tax=Streptomyces sp. NA04227 TaxID=2742136 RepID=UPI0015913E53|nr:class I SAM-dependent methyltransferase [Streptomyces sp. NA04227]QKW09741.1 class I SAM-dependent methyltransferase [Streptomyces sp. NA04227]